MKWLILLLFFPLNLYASQCGKGMDKSLVGGGCVCPIGKDWRYDQCVSYGVPEFAIDNDEGGWQCIEGYVQKGKRCEKYIVPVADSKLVKVAVHDCDATTTGKCKLPKQIQSYLLKKQKTQL
ncbi:hypothetical protein [Pseudoalteromonas spongiae]|uniref:hypothetical protein n=1 Tax=Pseudoalteromonas spongiae TaxID=298657 RepID=UPI00373604F0